MTMLDREPDAYAHLGEWMPSGREPGPPPHRDPRVFLNGIPPPLADEAVLYPIWTDSGRESIVAVQDWDGCQALVVALEPA